MSQMPVFFHSHQLDFHPKYEWILGNRIKHPETTRRAESIVKSLKSDARKFEFITPPRIPLYPIRETHNYQLITLYNTASQLSDEKTFYPSVFPQRMKAGPDPTNIFHAGFYCFDSGTPLNNKTWTAAAWSAATAYYAADWVKKGKGKVAYALSRPPGHHASKDAYGGYCYFNNAAIATKLLRKNGRVAIVDIDFHHGNGTQDMFYRDDKVLTVSIHGDPREHFPYFCGFPSEIGSGKGDGFNFNIILPNGTKIKDYMKNLNDIVIPTINRFEPQYLVICAGMDTYELDPVGKFGIKTPDFKRIGELLSSLDLPTVIIQEGGYHTRDLGKNVCSFLSGFKLT